ncbi:MAG: hypothetical protein ABI602_02305 [Candidatus Saccharibacteria bacterium]
MLKSQFENPIDVPFQVTLRRSNEVGSPEYDLHLTSEGQPVIDVTAKTLLPDRLSAATEILAKLGLNHLRIESAQDSVLGIPVGQDDKPLNVPPLNLTFRHWRSQNDGQLEQIDIPPSFRTSTTLQGLKGQFLSQHP